MLYVQDKIEKCVFPDIDSDAFSYFEQITIDTEIAREKTLAVMETCKEILLILDRLEK